MICTPNLPKNRVKTLLIGEKYSELVAPLAKLGISAVLLPNIKGVSPYLSGHVDLAVLATGDSLHIADSVGQETTQKLELLGFKIKARYALSEKYPDDAILNACVLGSRIIHRADISELGKCEKIINVRQGYTKCNICVVNENAIITSDPSIAKVCKLHNIDVLEIKSGYINLEGFDTGFIGGASFKISENELAFTGTLKSHPSYIDIICFLERYAVQPIYLTERKIYDIGSAVLLTENAD